MITRIWSEKGERNEGERKEVRGERKGVREGDWQGGRGEGERGGEG